MKDSLVLWATSEERSKKDKFEKENNLISCRIIIIITFIFPRIYGVALLSFPQAT